MALGVRTGADDFPSVGVDVYRLGAGQRVGLARSLVLVRVARVVAPVSRVIVVVVVIDVVRDETLFPAVASGTRWCSRIYRSSSPLDRAGIE